MCISYVAVEKVTLMMLLSSYKNGVGITRYIQERKTNVH